MDAIEVKFGAQPVVLVDQLSYDSYSDDEDDDSSHMPHPPPPPPRPPTRKPNQKEMVRDSRLHITESSELERRRRKIGIVVVAILIIIAAVVCVASLVSARSSTRSDSDTNDSDSRSIEEKDKKDEYPNYLSGDVSSSSDTSDVQNIEIESLVPSTSSLPSAVSSSVPPTTDIEPTDLSELGPLSLSVEQITFGDKHHMFGYIGQSLTIPWNADDRYIVGLEFDSHDRLPTADDSATVILIDTDNSNEIIPLDTCRAWNTQQGTMLYWNPDSPSTQFFFNDRDEGNKIFTVLYDIEQRRRIREYRFTDTPIANAGVCPKGGFFYALNYARMARLRPVTGYQNTYDWTEGEVAPTNDGMWRVDVETGEKELLVSFADIAKTMKDEDDVSGIIADSHLYINHALSSRECSTVYFFGRGNYSGSEIYIKKPEMAIDKPFVMKSDGSGLKRVRHIGGHPEWSESESIVLGRIRNPGTENQIVKYNIISDTVDGSIGDGIAFRKTGGDLSLSPNGQMFANGWESEKYLIYHLVRLTDAEEIVSPPIYRGSYTKGNLRIDAAPRWNRIGNKLLVPGWYGERRQLNVISIENAAV
mmetsp:Transcript_29183/g.59185  ORF Transcript_29183/g.59185 Transcript_29183/m.59185 type:complete len:588 (-) Transcript_29183:507-2270(-)